MILDFHTHAFPERIAARTLATLAEIAGVTPSGDGTRASVERALESAHADLAVVLNIATKPGHETTINNFAAENDRGVTGQGKLYYFGSVHPDSPNALEELTRIRVLGLRGVKLHPDYQGFSIDDRKLYPLYERLSDLHLPVVFHAGWDPLSPEFIHAPPEKSARVLRDFPNLTVILAHFGGLSRYDEVETYLAGRFENLYLDTSCSAGYLEAEQAKRILRAQGADRVLFGSDFPWDTTENELAFLRLLGLDEAEERKILFENGARLLGIES